MKSLNEVTLSGNLGDAPAFAEDKRSAVLSVATNRSYAGADGEVKTDTQWHRVTVRGKLASACVDLVKGQRVLVMGEARNYSYDDNEGVKRWMHEVSAHTVALVLMPAKDPQ